MFPNAGWPQQCCSGMLTLCFLVERDQKTFLHAVHRTLSKCAEGAAGAKGLWFLLSYTTSHSETRVGGNALCSSHTGSSCSCSCSCCCLSSEFPSAVCDRIGRAPLDVAEGLRSEGVRQRGGSGSPR